MDVIFSYTARSATGQRVVGDIRANSEAQARVILRAQNLSPLEVRIKNHRQGILAQFLNLDSVDHQEVSFFVEQFAAMVKAGLRPRAAVRMLAGAAGNASWMARLNDMAQTLEEGKTLSATLERHKGVFDPFFIEAVRQAESKDLLAETLQQLSENLKSSQHVRDEMAGLWQ